MRATIHRSALQGEIFAASSKSVMQRALAAALLTKGITRIYNPGNSKDDLAALNIITKLGAAVNQTGDYLEITSPGFPHENLPETIKINCCESGLAARMFVPIFALSSSEIIIEGEGSLLNRPMVFFEEVLPQLGVSVSTTAGKLPMNIQGPLQPKYISVDGSLSSQFLTGLLFSFGASVTEKTTIVVHDLKSRPYIDLTMEVMQVFGFKVQQENHRRFVVQPAPDLVGGELSERIIDYTIASDWSNAAFLLVAAATCGSITVKGLSTDSKQGDKAIIDVLRSAGANISMAKDDISVTKSDLKAFDFDATDCPDLFPPLAVLAAACTGKSVIQGISRLVNKESNRAETLKEIFSAMGISITLEGNSMIICGGSILNAELRSFNDHRIAMAATIAGLRATEVVINEAEAINKSYPAFYTDLQKLGADIKLTDN